MTTIKKQVCAAFLLAAMILSVSSARADTMNYTFTGSGNGLVNATPWSGAFTVLLTANTASIDTSATGFPRLSNIGGTFSEGAVTDTLSPMVTLVASSGLDLINFFNSSFNNGLGLLNVGLAGYDLSTPIGPIFGAFLTPTFNGGSFGATNGDTIKFLGDGTLTFTATPVGAPEPSTLLMLGAGLAGLVLLAFKRRRVTAQTIA